MARIVVITHEYDQFSKRRGLLLRPSSNYMLFDVTQELTRRGHSVVIRRGLDGKADGDAAILHVDATVTPQDYLDYARSFPLCLNLAATDIAKRHVSGAVLAQGDNWPGPVIVKTDLNHGGGPERRYNRHAARAGKAPPYPDAPEKLEYTVHARLADVPANVFDDPNLIVERFIPERDADGYALRFWLFCGEAERCSRTVSPRATVKARDTLRWEPVEVPDELRARRRELGFDYGKFDFAMHDGKATLLDANRTPGRSANLAKMFGPLAPLLTDGFEGLLRRKELTQKGPG